MFVGREYELKKLNNLYRSDKFQFPVIYGRRRVGKTALINEFIGDKEAIFFTGVESNEKQNLENFSRSIMNYISSAESVPIFSSFQAALEYVFELAKSKRLILIIDEYPYVAKASKSLASTLQMLIDRNKDTSKLFLILCGSSMSFMENHVLGYKAPLYGRRTAQFKLQPFNFFEASKYFTGFSHTDMALIYGMVGGTPQYLLQMDDSLSVEDNIKNTYLNPTSALFEEPTNLLKQEVREQAIYNAVISAIATGATRLSEISTKVGEDTSSCAIYIKNLISLGIVKKEVPITEKSAKKTLYSIEDNMFRFWYRFIPDNISSINRNMPDLVYKRIEPFLSDYMGPVFEEICKQYMWKMLSEGEFEPEFNDIGRWWGNNPKRREQAEIDILATVDKDSAMFGECKWKNERVDTSVLETLVERSNLFNYTNKYLYLFSKSGFTDGCVNRAGELGNVNLVSFEDMWGD
jgi:AAA+ ATPase superfamily predicted ATPase